MRTMWKKLMALLLVATISIGEMNLTVFAQEMVENSMATDVSINDVSVDTISANDVSENNIVGFIEETVISNPTQMITENIYEGDGFRVVFDLDSYWDTGYNATIKLENTGDSSIQNWSLKFVFNNAITGIWNAEIVSLKEHIYEIKNVGWNQDIAPGSSVEFGISGDQAFAGIPENYMLINASAEVAEEDYLITYDVDGDWGVGFYGSISITNNTPDALEDWVLEFDFNREITEIWDGVIESHEGSHYVVRNAGYNSTISSGKMIAIGIKGGEGSIEEVPINYSLTTYGNYEEIQNEVDLNLDSDSDGAEDYIEEYFGTDINKSDTDEDGLSDFIELYALVLDPLEKDTDGNGVADGDEDLDGDGLTNLDEVQISTSIVKQDTDEDGLSDLEEHNEYSTNPVLRDTDGDGASDEKEIQIETNPLIYDESFRVTVRSEETDSVKASVDIELSGKQVKSLSVNKVESEFLFPTDMPGYIGSAYEFSVDGSFDIATIRFEFDEALLLNSSFDPIIYYFNEETQTLEALTTVLEGNVASAEVTHFSKYILLNRKVFQSAFEWQDEWSTLAYSGVEVVLVIDDSGSMAFNDENNQRLTVAQKLIDNLPRNSKVGVVKFTSGTTRLTTSLTDDRELAKSYLTTNYFYSTGGTNTYSAINSAFTLFETSNEQIMKMMIVLSDGESADGSKHSSVVTTANDKKVKIYTVALGGDDSEYSTEYLEALANNTAGTFYLSPDAEQLETIYDDINKRIDIETDSDGDGIADYYEEHMVMFNGVTIVLDKNNPDTDGDGLSDGKEVAKLNYQYNADKTKVIVTGKVFANPIEADTDGDGISDEEESIIGTDPKIRDTDNDRLNDGYEYTHGFDPLAADIDGDGRLDSKESQDGTDPYSYNKDWYEHVWDFVCGFVAGDFIADTDSLPTVMGQITSSLIPYVDIRDIAGNLVHGDYTFAGLSAVSLFPVAGDSVKAVAKAGKFAAKNVDDLPKIAKLLEFLDKNFPDIVKLLNKSDEFAEAARQLSKTENIKLTRKQAKALTEAFENAGLSHYLLKTDALTKEAVDTGANVWEEVAINRGKIIDDYINRHTSGKPLWGGESLGKNFPVFDRLDGDKIISTKSIDIAAQSYQNPVKLKNMLNRHIESMKSFETKYMNLDNSMKWGGTELQGSDYSTKVLEIVLPDVVITEDILKVLNEFRDSMPNGIEVWYKIAK